MDITASASAHWDAGHSIPGLARCAREGHGHFYTAKVDVTGDLNPATGWPFGSDTLQDVLERIAAELNGRNLDDMLPGVVSSATGLAIYILERTSAPVPAVVGVTVSCSDGTEGRATRTRR